MLADLLFGDMLTMMAKGFSLIELVVTIVVLMAVSMLAIPAFQSAIGNSQIRTVAESIKNGLQQARVEAIKRNGRIRFTLQTDSTWQFGCEPVPASNMSSTSTCPAIIGKKSASEGSSSNIAISADNYSVVFNSFGTRDPGVQNALSRVDVSNSQVSSSERRALRVLLAAGGYSKVCDPAVTIAGDPRKC
jgi:type IV fimbrial biogenesis protein FimT